MLQASQLVGLFVCPVDTGLETDYSLNKLLIIEIILKSTEIKFILEFNYKELLVIYFC